MQLGLVLLKREKFSLNILIFIESGGSDRNLCCWNMRKLSMGEERLQGHLVKDKGSKFSSDYKKVRLKDKLKLHEESLPNIRAIIGITLHSLTI